MAKIYRDRMGIGKVTADVDIENPHTLWARTEVLVSQGEVIRGKGTAKSTFAPGAPFTKEHNMVPIGGVQYAFEKIFGIQGTQFSIPTLYDLAGIGSPNSIHNAETYLTPDGYKEVLYQKGHCVQLYGIGITSTAENDSTVYPVTYRENSIDMTRVTSTGLTLRGKMIPFRYTTEALNSTERKQYFGKKLSDDGNTGYYLKRFESEAEIKHVWKIDDKDDNSILISGSEVWNNASKTNTEESFVEMILKISKKDVKEWFEILNQKDRARVNTLALFSGNYVKNPLDASDYGDYQDVLLFSKLNIPIEHLSLSKDLNIIYRVYGA